MSICMNEGTGTETQGVYATSAEPLQVSPKLHLGQGELQEGSPFVGQKFRAPFRVLFATFRSLQRHLGVLFTSVGVVCSPQRLWT